VRWATPSSYLLANALKTRLLDPPPCAFYILCRVLSQDHFDHSRRFPVPELKTYVVFISHAWRYHEDYDRLVRTLNDAPNSKWRNSSVPRHDPN